MLLAGFLSSSATVFAQAVVEIALTSYSSYTQNFDTLANTGTTNSTLPAGWALAESGGGARDNDQYAADTGDSNIGDTYSYGSAAVVERGLGTLQSGTLVPLFGAVFRNDTGAAIKSLNIAYTGEQWHLGTPARTDQLNFQYSLDATSLTTGTWTDVSALNFTAPVTTGITGALDGNAAPNRTLINGSISGLDIANGATFWIRWQDINAAGADDGLAVDDFSLTPAGCTSSITVINANDSGAGSLRQAIADVCDGGTITFAGSYIIPLNSELSIYKNLTIDGTGQNVILSGGNSTGVIYVGNYAVNLRNLTIANGRRIGGGAGIYLYYGTLNLTAVTLSNNTSIDPVYAGGGIYNYYGNLTIRESTFAGNTATNSGGSGGAGGGVYNNSGAINIRNSTFSGNSASDASGDGSGGAILCNFGTLIVQNSTFSGNTATVSNGGSAAGGILSYGPGVTLRNTILANNPPTANCSGTITNGGNNLESGAACGFGAGLGSLSNAAPRLGPLGNYGGLTPTIPLLPGSPAINGVTYNAPNNCPATDQRGAARPQIGACDIGAFESQGFTLNLDGGNNQSTAINTAFVSPLAVNVTANNPAEPVDGGLVAFTPPVSGASAVLTGSPAAISGGAASVTAAANGSAGAYTVTAETHGAASGLTFSLTNLTGPTVATGAATALTGSSATLNGTVNANGVSTTVTFEYGPDTSYGSTITAAQSPVSGAADTAVSAVISGLTPNILYHFRVVGVNADGAANGVDQTFMLTALDYGDLPDSYGTLLASDGARHIVPAMPTLYLGSGIDAENDGAPTANAAGDDTAYTDDEDGVSVVAPALWQPGLPAQVNVTASSTGFLNAWMDFNGNGNFWDAGERIFNDQPLSGGVNPSIFIIPPMATSSLTTGIPARFRLSAAPGAVNSPTGLANSGEVEDYVFHYPGISINDVTADEGNAGTTTFTFTVSLSEPAPAGGVTFDIAVTDNTATAADNDYIPKFLSGQTIPAGSSTYTFDVTVNGDALFESDETFFVNLSNVTGASVTDGQGLGTIANDDVPPTPTHTPLPPTPTHTPVPPTPTYTPVPPTPTSTVPPVPSALTLNQAAAQADPANAAPIRFTVVFSKPVDPATFTPADVTLTDSTTPGALTVTVVEIAPHDGTTFEIAVSGMSGAGKVIAAIAAGRVQHTDADLNAASSSSDNEVTYDNVNPVVVSTDLKPVFTGSGPVRLAVTFSKNAANPAGHTGEDDVSNIANYLLVDKGPDGLTNTISCRGGLLGDDSQAPVSHVDYDSTTFKATVTLAGRLPVGRYRLFVCGTTSIVDLAGNPLNGGTDSIIDFEVRRELPVPEELPATGFPVGGVTKLPIQPLSKGYTVTNLLLEIPSLGQKMTIVGVPQSDTSWDVTWLGSEAGWLNGSAYPTWAGNTVITGHVWDSQNRPGPFAQLRQLKYGDLLRIHAYGQVYTYEVRESRLVSADEVAAVMKHEELDWVTLVTCEAFNAKDNAYSYRRVVRAVLVEVK